MLDLKIAKPCDQSWTAMKGDERVRHCGRCDHDVYNISEMTEAEVEALIVRTEGKFCARLYRRTDNRVMTKDCPKGVAATRRRGVLALAAAGASMAFAFSFARPVYAGAAEMPRRRLAPVEPVEEITPPQPEMREVVGKPMVPLMGAVAPSYPRTKILVIPKREKP